MRARLGYLLIVIIVLGSALVLRVVDPAPVAQLRQLVFDSYQRLEPRVINPALPVRIVDIDEEALAKYGRWPWPRSRLARLLRALAAKGAVVVGIDIVFPGPDFLSPSELLKLLPDDQASRELGERLRKLPAGDKAFAAAIGAASVVLGFDATFRPGNRPPARKAGMAFAGDDPAFFVPSLPGARANLPMLDAQAKGSGVIVWLPDRDQIVRRVPLIVNVNGKLHPAFSLETLRVAMKRSTYLVKSSGASGEEDFGQSTGITNIYIDRLSIPTDANGQLWLRFTPHDRRRYISAASVLDGSVNEAEIKGRVILIGSSAPGLHDIRTTPLDAIIPGVEIHAQAIEQMISGEHLIRPDFALGAEVLMMLIAGGLLAWLIRHSGAAWGALVGAASLVSVAGLSWFAYTSTPGWLVDPVYPTLALTVLYIAATSYHYKRSETNRDRVHAAFSHYMAPTMVEELAANPDLLQLGGETRDVTILFADIRGFTGLSEGMQAEDLTRFLNQVFTPLSEIILDTRGTIDKFIGDAVMAFWNAPLDDPDHARHACIAALHMVDALHRLNADMAAEAEANGLPVKTVRMGFGLNTGPCCVGNLGSEQRFDYSVIGDDVNIAARLEHLSKRYEIPVLVGEATAKAVPGMAFLPLMEETVAGKRQSVEIYALLGDEAFLSTAEFVTLKASVAAVRTALMSERFADAEKHLERLHAPTVASLPAIKALYRMQIEQMREAATPLASADEITLPHPRIE